MCQWHIAAAETLDPFGKVIVFVGRADPSIMGLLGICQPLVEEVGVSAFGLAPPACGLVLFWPGGRLVRHAASWWLLLAAGNQNQL